MRTRTKIALVGMVAALAFLFFVPFVTVPHTYPVCFGHNNEPPHFCTQFLVSNSTLFFPHGGTPLTDTTYHQASTTDWAFGIGAVFNGNYSIRGL
jgi:hypothetical protein